MKTIGVTYSCVKNVKSLVKMITNNIFNSKSLRLIWKKLLARLTNYF